ARIDSRTHRVYGSRFADIVYTIDRMENQSLETEFAALDEQIRREAEKKMQAIRVVAKAHKNLADTREEFARTDAANKKSLTDALAAARSAGFSESDLKRWQAEDNKLSRRGSQRRNRKTPQKDQPATPAVTAAADSSPQPADESLAATA
ncbi:MAG: hypothetical protein WAW17_26960, partial [Rhodococcus sp. (in: high G+C Gram-positive bacteria)]|uniref:hypothetical protein n=1 Tax=Rhodococcus sp. TaxID=1831 RepID=UPI003BAFCE4B